MRTRKKLMLLALSTIFVAITLCVLVSYAEDESDQKPIQPVLDSITSATPRYLPVVFANHDAHAKKFNISCKTCHHELKSENEKPTPCSSCHNKTDAKVDLTSAMHKSCRGCHTKHKKENKDSIAPVDCLSCHTERK